MLDFLRIGVKSSKDCIEIYPKFYIMKSSHLMIRGGDFYAIWVEEKGLWSTDEDDAIRLIDIEVEQYVETHKKDFGDNRIVIQKMIDGTSGAIDRFHKYCQKQMRDNYHALDEHLTFSNNPTNKEDYASRRLPYPLESGDHSGWDELVSTLYSSEERRKIEWAIGAIVSGESKTIQKFLVFYGSAGTGKSTILNIEQKLFDGYYSTFVSKDIASVNSAFALEPFKNNPLVGIEHDADLSKIEDNSRLNSLISHEIMSVNTKNKSIFTMRFNTFMLIGTNRPVKITDAKSGIIRRLIDVTPTGEKIPKAKYKALMNKIDFELGAIACHCLEVFRSDPGYYDDYIPISMIGATNDFYNFVQDSYFVFDENDGTTLKAAWEMYRQYCDESNIAYPFSKRIFKEELKNYFTDYFERITLADGTRARSFYKGFRREKLELQPEQSTNEETKQFPELNCTESIFDRLFANCPAQYAYEKAPQKKWAKCGTTLKDLDTKKLHYIKVPKNHIVIDFDLKDEAGNKSLDCNLKAASAFPPTYSETSQSGSGLHLHYIYTGDPSELSRLYDTDIEIKVPTGDSALRRKLSKCNDLPIAELSSGLPLKEKKMVKDTNIKNEKHLRALINKALKLKIDPHHAPSINFVEEILNDAYSSGMTYDVSDMLTNVLSFASKSTNQSSKCIKKVNNMHFRSKDIDENQVEDIPFQNDVPIVFFDCEVFPNLFLVNYKLEGPGKGVVRMINPSPVEIENLISNKLIGFNCRRYDNHILYARLNGYNNEQLYNLSQRIISGDRNAMFGQAYNLSYTDIYDFASAGNKMSLKKLEIEMGITHKELGLPWDQPVPEDKWPEVAEYCDNDVIATEAAFYYLKADWTAREILASITDMTVNTSTNTLTTKFIFGNERHPQNKFMYRDLSKPVHKLPSDMLNFLNEACPEMMSDTHGPEKSLLPYFPGYKFDHGISTYRDFSPDNPNKLFKCVGEGGNVYTEPGIYHNVGLYDIASQHPHSIIAEYLFGPYTDFFREIVVGRINIKHEDWEKVAQMFGGKLKPYIQDVLDGKMTSKDLANALKTAINSVYGLTDASFENPFRDPRNIDNIVAKRGALFMIDLRLAVQEQGYKVVHVKTDSIKIADADDYIWNFVYDFGKRYGYTFEHEATYSKMCLINKAVYIARYSDDPVNGKKAGQWTPTGKPFIDPYIFKTLFSHEPIDFKDMCETFQVQTALYLDRNESLPDGDHNYEFIGKVGQFCPVINGVNGGYLYRLRSMGEDGNLDVTNAPNATGFRWVEASDISKLGLEDHIDKSFYRKKVDKAVEAINEFGDFDKFVEEN